MIKNAIKFADALVSLQEFQDETNKTLTNYEKQIRQQQFNMDVLLQEIKILKKENEELRDRILRIEDRQIESNNHYGTAFHSIQNNQPTKAIEKQHLIRKEKT